MHLLSIKGWNVHLEADWNMWLIGVSWATHSQGDIGIYFGPVNLQIEHYDRGVTQEPKPEDAVDDPDPRRAVTDEEFEKLHDMSDLTAVERDKMGLPMDVYVARNIHRHTYDPRVYIPACDCVVHGRTELNPVAIAPRVRLVRGVIMPSADFWKLRRWINLNRATLLSHWRQEIDADEALLRLKPLNAHTPL
jgi:hypothetical protein